MRAREIKLIQWKILIANIIVFAIIFFVIVQSVHKKKKKIFFHNIYTHEIERAINKFIL